MPSSFPDSALISREFLLQELRKGKTPEGKWTWVANKQEAGDVKELAAIHKLNAKVGLLYQTTDDSDSATVVKLPVLRAGQVTIEEFIKIAPLVVDVPGKLGQTVRKSSVSRLRGSTIPREFAKEGAWKATSSNVQNVIHQLCSDDIFQSTAKIGLGPKPWRSFELPARRDLGRRSSEVLSSKRVAAAFTES